MKELSVNDVTYSAGDKTLFTQIDLHIHSGDHVGLIGRNGSGKSTLLDIIAGIKMPDSGSIKKPKNYEISYLSQATHFPAEQTVLDIIFAGNSPMMRAVRLYESLLQELAKYPEDSKLQKKLLSAQQLMDREQAWEAEAEAKSILTRLGIKDVYQTINALSGGQQKRVALAQALIQSPDLLILDEPTNHLDFAMIYWLEKYLQQFNGAFIVVTHDRYFLDRVVDRIYELDHQTVTEYPGNYEAYMEQKANQELLRQQQAHKNQKLYQKELAWMREGVRARGTKQKARIDRFKDLAGRVKNSTSAREIQFNFPTSRLGKQVIELSYASFAFSDGTIILDEFTKIFQKHQRIGITGLNGSGKSSFLNILAGILPLDRGELVVGETVRLGYYRQHFAQIDENKRVIEYLQEIAQEVKTQGGQHLDVSQLLERFLFPRSMHGARIRQLSGGEKRRLYLVQILMQLPNVLLLDEPTNDLDIDTLRVLEDFLDDFPGTVIAVSHDRYFLDRMADQLLIFEGSGKITEYYGYLNDYLDQHSMTEQTAHKSQAEPRKRSKSEHIADKKKMSYHEQKEWQTIEQEIMELEDAVTQIEKEMAELNNDEQRMVQENGYIELMKMQAKKENLEDRLLEKMERWEYLSDLA